jgi:hypothetical protein
MQVGSDWEGSGTSRSNFRVSTMLPGLDCRLPLVFWVLFTGLASLVQAA